VLGTALYRQPDFVDSLADDATLQVETTRAVLVEEALDTLDWREDDATRRSGLRRFKRRHLLRIGARDVLGMASLDATGRELSSLADACVEAALRSLEPTLPFAVIGLGRLGGAELSYASDIDVIFVYEGTTAADFDAAERIATRLVRAIGDSTSEGRTFRIDTRLRPEGNQGPLARSLDGYESYLNGYAQTWELQALTKARFVAGDAGVADRYADLAQRFVYRDPFPEEWRREIRRMKARIERERIPPGEDPQFHLKLGRGSLSDVEFTVQLLQLVHGGEHPDVHCIVAGGVHRAGEAYAAELRGRVEALGLGSRVHFIGFRADIPDVMNAWDAVVHASVRPEPFGRVILEGMLLGKPVIATAAGGVPELIDDGRTGFLVSPGNVAAMADALRRVLSAPADARSIGARAREWARQQFSLTKQVAEMSEIYEGAARIH